MAKAKFVVTLETQVPPGAEDLEELRKYLIGVLENERESSWEDAPMHIESYEVGEATPVPRVLIEVLHGAVSDVASDQPVDVRVLDYDTEEKQPEEWDVPVKPAYVGGHF